MTALEFNALPEDEGVESRLGVRFLKAGSSCAVEVQSDFTLEFHFVLLNLTDDEKLFAVLPVHGGWLGVDAEEEGLTLKFFHLEDSTLVLQCLNLAFQFVNFALLFAHVNHAPFALPALFCYGT